MKAKKYKMGGQVDPRKKYSTKPMTSAEYVKMMKKKEFDDMKAKYTREYKRTLREEAQSLQKPSFKKGGKMSMYMGGGVMEYLKGGQMKLDANKDGMISKADFEMLRKMKKFKNGGKIPTDPRKKYSVKDDPTNSGMRNKGLKPLSKDYKMLEVGSEMWADINKDGKTGTLKFRGSDSRAWNLTPLKEMPLSYEEVREIKKKHNLR